LKRLLLNNYRFKLTSIVIAVMLWWFVYSEHHPQYRAEISIPVTYENLAKSMRIQKGPEKIRVRLSGETEALKDADERKIKAIVDLGSLAEGKHVVTVRLENETSARVLGRNLTEEVELKKLNKTELPVSFKFHGALPLGLRMGQMLMPGKISVYGTMEDLTSLGRVRADIDLSNHKESFSERVTLKAVDKSGVVMSHVNLDPNRITVRIPVEKESEILVPIVLKQKKSRDKGDFDKVDFTPTQVTLYGDEAALKNISSLDTEEFDLSLCSKGGVFAIRLIYPADVIPSEKRVTVSCEPPKEISREFEVNVKAINICEDCYCEGCDRIMAQSELQTVLPDGVKVITTGPNHEVNRIKFSDISSVADLLDLPPGRHRVRLHVSLTAEVQDVYVNFSPEEMDIIIVKGR